jgi:hypothetical protein
MNTYRYRPDYWGDDGPDPLRPGPEEIALVMQQTADWDVTEVPEKGDKGDLWTDEELPW